MIAALTLPNLIADYKKKVYVAQLKKSVSVLEQGFQKMLSDSGVDNLEDAEGFRLLETSYSYDAPSTEFEEYLKKYFQITSISHKSFYFGTVWLTGPIDAGISYFYGSISFADGCILYTPRFYKNSAKLSDVFCQQYKKQGTRSCTLHGSFIIDVNGNKKPNKVGRDMFYFYLTSEGYLIPQYGHDYYGYYWRNDALNGCGEPDKPLTSKSRSRGIGCAARIIENGWVMDY